MNWAKICCDQCWKISVVLAVLCMAKPVFSFSEQPILTFIRPGEKGGLMESKIVKYSLLDLRKKIRSRQVSLFDPIHKKQKMYEVFPFKSVLDVGFGKSVWRNEVYSDIEFVAQDGYQSMAKTLTLQEDGAFLAFRDLDGVMWEPFAVSKVDPGPFYLFWIGADQTSSNEYLWFWQLTSLRLLKFEDLYPRVVPLGAKKDTAVYLGYTIFRGQCFRCHAMDRQGSKIGPDLNAPQNIMGYRSKKMVKRFIKEPSHYRYTTMPDNPHLTDQDLNHLIAYFLFQNKSKK